jgi:hypothetical protein
LACAVYLFYQTDTRLISIPKQAGQNPDSALAKLNGPTPKFTSRYADPNNPASSGNLFSLLTGGHFNPPDRRQLAAAQWGGGGVRGIGLGGGFGGLGGFREARMAMMGGGGGSFGARQQMVGGYRTGAYGYTQDPNYMQPQQQGYIQGTPGQQGGTQPPYGYQNSYQNQTQMRGMGIGGYGGPVGLEALVSAILGTGTGAGPGPGFLIGQQNPIKRILSQVSRSESFLFSSFRFVSFLLFPRSSAT